MFLCSSSYPLLDFHCDAHVPVIRRWPGANSGIRSLSIPGLTNPSHPPVSIQNSSEQQVGGGTSSRSSFGRRELISLLRRFLVVSPPIRYVSTPTTKSRPGSLLSSVVFPIGGGGGFISSTIRQRVNLHQRRCRHLFINWGLHRH